MGRLSLWLAFLMIGFLFMITACKPASTEIINTGLNHFEVESQFQDLYNTLGGIEVLGPAISPQFNHLDAVYQYTAAALFVYDPTHPPESQISLAPIGLELGIADDQSPEGDINQEPTIYPGFHEYYTLLGGRDIVGSPITNVQYNIEKRRLEQHFENLGFYQLDSDQRNQIHLLHYGAWMCSTRCDFSSPSNSTVSLFKSAVGPFIEEINSLDVDFLGRPITKPYIAPDGKIQQIFYNVVLIASPDDIENFYLRPIPKMIGIPIEPGTAHDIPEHMQTYIDTKIGALLAGPAITAYAQQSQNMYRQCFENFCLNYFPNYPLGERIVPVPLGYLYRQRYYKESETYTPEMPTEALSYSLTVWEDAPIVEPNEPQTIGVSVYKNGVPVSNIQTILHLKLPEGIKIKYTIPATQVDGTTSLTLNPIDAPHGTIIAYDVCLDFANDEKNCTNESFLIWGNP